MNPTTTTSLDQRAFHPHLAAAARVGYHLPNPPAQSAPARQNLKWIHPLPHQEDRQIPRHLREDQNPSPSVPF